MPPSPPFSFFRRFEVINRLYGFEYFCSRPDVCHNIIPGFIGHRTFIYCGLADGCGINTCHGFFIIIQLQRCECLSPTHHPARAMGGRNNSSPDFQGPHRQDCHHAYLSELGFSPRTSQKLHPSAISLYRCQYNYGSL